MKINSVPVEAYRQAAQSPARQDELAGQKKAEINRESSPDRVSLPRRNADEPAGLKLNQSSNVLRGALSTEEKAALVRSFARYGDSVDENAVYGNDARAGHGPIMGRKVDVRI